MLNANAAHKSSWWCSNRSTQLVASVRRARYGARTLALEVGRVLTN